MSRHLSLDDVRYFERAMSAYKSVKGTEAVNDFFGSIDQSLRGKEVLVAKHKVCSRFMEQYIQECPLESLQRLFVVFSGQFADLATDKFASHTVEHMVRQGIQFIDNEITPSFRELLASLINELTPAAASLAEDPAGTHVDRVILGELSAIESFTQKIDKFARKIIQAIVQNPRLISKPHVSGTLQVLAGMNHDQYAKLLKYLVSSVPLEWRTVCDRSGSKLVEALIQGVGDDVIRVLYEKVFSDGAARCCEDDVGNYVLQKWLEFVQDPDMIAGVAEQLLSILSELLGRRPQVAVALSVGLANAAPEYQTRFLDAIEKEARGRNIVEYLNGLASPNGPKIVQSLCHFDAKAANRFIEAMKSLGSDKIVACALDKAGSYFVSEFVRTKTIDIKAREKIIRRLIPHAKELAGSRFGSFVLDAMFNASDLATKAKICEAINNDEVRKSAPNIWKFFRMDQFRTKREQWEKDTVNIMKRSDAMSDIIETVSVPAPKPIKTEVAAPTSEVAEAAKQLEESLGPIHKKRRRRKHEHPEE